MSPTATLLLSPPYRSLVPLAEMPGPPRLGTVALLRWSGGPDEVIVSIPADLDAAPWVPLVVEVRADQRLTSLVAAPVAVILSCGAGPPAPTAILSALSRRTGPSPEQLGAWLAGRLGQPALGDILAAATGYGRSLRHPVHDRAVRRALGRHGLPRRLEWTRLGDLTRYQARTGEAAARLGGEERLAYWLARLVGVSIRTWRRHPGWEWLAERFVRRRLCSRSWGRAFPGPA